MVAQKLGEMASIGALALAFALSGCASSGTREATFELSHAVESNTDQLQAREPQIARTR